MLLEVPPSAAINALAMSSPRGFRSSMNPAMSATYRPANGLWMTASAAARRSGVLGGGPPSWKTSSTVVSIFLTRTSGMNQAPLRVFRQPDCRQAQPRANDSRFSAQVQRGGMNQAFCRQSLSHSHTRLQGAFHVFSRKDSYTLRHQQLAQVAVRRQAARRHARNPRISGKIHRIGDDS